MSGTYPVRQSYRADTPVQLLGRPVEALLTVTDEQAAALHGFGIRTVLDLGASSLFATAVRIAADRGGRRSPGDLVDDDAAAEVGAPLADRAVEVLRAVDAAAATAFRDTFGIVTVRELAAWPPYVSAARVVADAYGDPVGDGADEERPDDLVPVSRRYATERVQYDVIVFDEVLDAPERRRNDQGQQPQAEPQDIRAAGGIDVADLVSATLVAQPAIGAVLTFRQSWFPQGLALGQLLHSTALSPGESTRIAMVDWTRRVRGSTTEATDQMEQVASDVSRTRALSEVSNAVAREAQSGFSESASEAVQRQQATSRGESEANVETGGLFGTIATSLFGGSLGGPKVSSFGSSTALSTSSGWASSSSSSQGERTLTAELMQNVSDRTQQAASSTRSRRATTVVETSQHEAESLTTRSVTNYNHMHALTIQHYEVVQIHRVVLELARLSPCLFVPMKLVSFDERVVRRYKSVIAAAGLTSEVRMLGAAEPDRFVLGAVGIVGGWDRQNLAEVGQALGGPAAQPGDAAASLPLDGLRLIAVGSSADEFGAQISAVVVVLNNGRRIIRPVVDRAEAHNAWIPRFAADLGGIAPREVAAIALVRIDPAAEGEFPVMLSFDVDRPDRRPASVEVNVPALVLGGPITVGAGAEVGVFAVGVTVGSVRLLEHLEENALHYSNAIWRSLDAATITTLLATYRIDDRRLIEVIDPIPVTVSGNYLVFRYHGLDDEADAALRAKLDGAGSGPTEDLVPLPSGGVFAEAVLGRSNSAEKLDITRFWNWQDSPIPILPPEINPLTAGGKDNPPDPQTGTLEAPVVNIVNPPALPDPAGLAPVYQAIANGAMFRDMSGLAQTAALLQTAIQAAQAGAADATQAAGEAQSVAAQQLTELLKLAAQVALTAVTGGAGGALGAAAGALGAAGAAGGGGGVARTATNAGALINQGREMDQRPATGGSGGAQTDGDGGGAQTGGGGGATEQGTAQSASAGNEQVAFGSAIGGGMSGIPATVLGTILGQTGTGASNAGGSGSRTDWNVYMFVIGTDNQGGSDFNVMRQWRLAHVDLAEPSVVVTFDFRAGELRKSWRESADRQPTTQRMPLAGNFDVVYGDIEAAGRYGRIRELHFLTHFGDDRIWFQPHRASSAGELAGRSAALFAAAFSPDALVKVHGCQHDEALVGRIRSFCESGGTQGGPALRREVQNRLAGSYPVVLSRMAGVPVWASPMGAAAFYSCSYLPADEKGKRFCIETDSSLAQSYGNTVKFYEANYAAFFPRAADEKVFDDTRHLKYKSTPLSGSPRLKPCGP